MVRPQDRYKTYKRKRAAEDPNYRRNESIRINNLRKDKWELMAEEEKVEEREKHRLYMRQWRRKKSGKDEEAGPSAAPIRIAANPPVASPKSQIKQKIGFRSKPALRKAVKRLMDVIPSSPSKRKGAVTELAKECGLVVSPPSKKSTNECPSTESSPCSSKGHSSQTTSLVTDFFFRTDIVYTSPGLKDEITVWENGKKQKLRKYYLEVTIKEAFALFKQEHPEVSIGLSKFYELKPPNVIYMSKAPLDQCKCVTHENFRLLLKGLKAEIKNDSFWETTLCHDKDLNSECWKSECGECSDGQLLRAFVSRGAEDDSKETTWYTWEAKESSTKKGKEVKRTILKEGCVGELKDLVLDSWSHYIEHVRIKRIMSKEFQNDLNKENTLLMQVDFAMDYNSQHNSKEVQSAIYGRTNVTIFTAAIHHKGKWLSYAVVTDSDKYKNTVRQCMLMILDDFLKTDITGVTEFIIWSDGPSCEFRNQYTTGKLLLDISRKINLVSTWKYFATSHGKGVCDGIGGALKARVAEHCRGKHSDDTVMVQGFEDFWKLANQYCPKVTTLKLSKEDVEEKTEREKPWDGVIPIAGVSSVHVAQAGLDGIIETWKLPNEGRLKSVKYPTPATTILTPDNMPQAPPTTAPEKRISEPNTDTEVDIVDRGWYIVMFEDDNLKLNYVCQMVGTSGDDVKVNSYVKCGGTGRIFKKYPEEELVERKQFLQKLQTPTFKKGGKIEFNSPVSDVK